MVPLLEVVSDPDHRVRKSREPAIGVEDVAGNVEVRRLNDDTAILGADVEAGADFISDTGPIQCADFGLSLGIQDGSTALDRRENISTYTALNKGIELAKAEVEDV